MKMMNEIRAHARGNGRARFTSAAGHTVETGAPLLAHQTN